MTDAVPALPPISAYLAVPDGPAAIAWYSDVFGGVETLRYQGDDGRIGHAEIAIGPSTLMLASEYPEMGVHAPGHYGGTSVMLYLPVADVDHTYARAVSAGAEGQQPPTDRDHGRSATIVDPFGHRWMLSTPRPDAALPERSEDEIAGGFTVTRPEP